MPKKPYAIVFIHGLAQKPAPEKLLELWVGGIQRDNPRPDVFAAPNQGIGLDDEGVPQELNYYADVFYGTDYVTNFDSYFEADASAEAEIKADGLADPDVAAPQVVTPKEQEFLAGFEAKLAANLVAKPPVAAATSPAAGQEGLEIAGLLPAPLREAIIKKAAMEAYYFLFNKEYLRKDGQRFMVREELRTRLLDKLRKAAEQAEKIVVVSHSMGTIVAYDVLRNCATCPPVDTLITLGSPLGVKEVQDELRAAGVKNVDFPAATTGRWINIYDPLDPICGADPKFANDFKAVDGKHVEDVKESNWGKWRHSINHYFSGTLFRKHLRGALGI